jgi:hypothetical protein
MSELQRAAVYVGNRVGQHNMRIKPMASEGGSKIMVDAGRRNRVKG